MDEFAYRKWLASAKGVGQKKSSGEYPEQEGGGKRVEKQLSLTLPII